MRPLEIILLVVSVPYFQCYNNIMRAGEGGGLSPDKIIGLTMRRAGVAITVTSVTNVMVFAIGATTVLPALRSFCLYCAVGIAAVYIYQVLLHLRPILDQRFSRPPSSRPPSPWTKDG